MTIELVPLCTVQATLAAPLVLPNTPSGTRVIVGVTEAVVDGERLRGRLKGAAAADWLVLAADGTATLDVRLTVETDDGALVFVQYRGRSDMSQGPTAPLYTAPLFETGDERYAWLNRIQAVAKGRNDGSTLTYEMYELR